MIKKIELINDLKKVRNKSKNIPSQNIYKKYGKYNIATFHRRFGSWNTALIECLGEIVQEKPNKRPIIKCLHCKKETKNPKFCSSNCAAIYNNKKRKKYIDKECIKCRKKIRHNCICCKDCLEIYKIEQFGKKTIKKFRNIPSSKNRYQKVRDHAHRIAKYYEIKKECPYCNYRNHVQLCHIRDIGDFPDNALLNEINNIKNLIYLCPNHHWDLDHGFFKL